MTGIRDYWSLEASAKDTIIKEDVPLQPREKHKYEPTVKGDNPCIKMYGAGPSTRQCGECKHFLRLKYHDKVYRKCELRKLTHGTGSDHKAMWQACGKFEQGV
jgi:hypothetical protein